MAKNVSNIMFFKKNQVCKIPPRGGTNVFLARGLNDARVTNHPTIFIESRRINRTFLLVHHTVELLFL